MQLTVFFKLGTVLTSAFNTDIALFVTSYTDQKTRNLKTYLNDCERAERASDPKIFVFSRFKFVGKSHICWGNSPRAPPPPPGYASGAHCN